MRGSGVRIPLVAPSFPSWQFQCNYQGFESDWNVTDTYAPFNISNYLDNDAVIEEYLTAAAQDTGLGHESLYKALLSSWHSLALKP